MRAANEVSREQRSESAGEVCGRPRCCAVPFLVSARTGRGSSTTRTTEVNGEAVSGVSEGSGERALLAD